MKAWNTLCKMCGRFCNPTTQTTNPLKARMNALSTLNVCIMKIEGSNITVNVKDLDKSISFYESIGLAVTNRWGNHYAQVTAPGIVIGLHPTANINLKGSSGNTSIGFIADNFEDAKSLLEKLSIETTQSQEEGGQFLFFNDPDGTALYFIKPNW